MMNKGINMDKNELTRLADDVIDDYFDNIDSVVDSITSKIIDAHGIEDNNDIKFLKEKVRRGILKWA